MRLGAFELGEVLGRGGMGDVYAGTHVHTGVAAAVKVMRERATGDARYAAWFRNEVRAVAGLSHPHIIEVFDHGAIPADVAAASEGRLHAGSPWLAMERADHGSLLQWKGRLDWTLLRGLLLALLDALAHAHARGVLHRDLKAANVLIAGPDRIVKLADFGLATPSYDSGEVEPSSQGVVGTPWYMAPEQFTGVRNDQGPWTDLYAFGCLAWALVAAAPPFPHREWAAARAAHLTERPPPLVQRVRVPDGVEDWLRTLLHKAPHHRFSSAAHAAWALLSLGDVPDNFGHSLTPIDAPSLPSSAHSTLSHSMADLPRVAMPAPHPPADRARLDQWPRPPLPLDWRASERRRTSTPANLGLGLFGLRAMPLIAREDERDALWHELRQMAASETPRAVLLRGAAGSGKSHLARWLGVRASELGVATAIHATYGTSPSIRDGLGPAIGRFHRASTLRGDVLRSHLRWELDALGITDEHEVNALARLVAPTQQNLEHFESVSARWAALQRHLQRLGALKPLVLWIDDAHRNLDALGFARAALEQKSPRVPALFVLTVRDEDLATLSASAEAIDDLSARPEVTTIEVGPLSADATRALARGLLGLHDDLARQIADRAGGNPLFAVQLVGDIVARGLLDPGPEGFVLRPRARLRIPANLEEVWGARLEGIFAQHEDRDRLAIELAALLGQQVDALEWHALCVRLNLGPPTGLLDELLEQHLAAADLGGPDFGWAFAHGMLRESLETSLRKRNPARWRELHAACADFLAEQNDVALSARIGRHRLAAGQDEAALGPLLAAASSPDLDPGQAEFLLARRERACELLGLAENDPRFLRGWLLRATLLLAQGRDQEAARWASRALTGAELEPQPAPLADAHNILAEIARRKHRFGQSLQLRRKAKEHATHAQHAKAQAEAMAGIGRLYLDVGNWHEAAEAYREAAQIARVNALDVISADCLTSLGYIAMKTGDEVDSEQFFDQASAYVNRSGSRIQQAHLLNALADLARKRGDFRVAEEHSRRALDHYLATGTRAARVMMLNLSLFQVLQGKYSDASRTLRYALEEELTGDEGRAFLAGCHAVLLPCMAHARTWSSWNTHLQTIEETFSGDLFVDDDTLAMLELAAALAQDAGQLDRAKAAWTLAHRLWTEMGREDRASAIMYAIARAENR